MAYNNKHLLTDASGKPIPQEYDPISDNYKPLTVMEVYGKSTDTKPTANVKIGTTYLELDTKDVYIFDGSSWGLF